MDPTVLIDKRRKSQLPVGEFFEIELSGLHIDSDISESVKAQSDRLKKVLIEFLTEFQNYTDLQAVAAALLVIAKARKRAGTIGAVLSTVSELAQQSLHVLIQKKRKIEKSAKEEAKQSKRDEKDEARSKRAAEAKQKIKDCRHAASVEKKRLREQRRYWEAKAREAEAAKDKRAASIAAKNLADIAKGEDAPPKRGRGRPRQTQ